MTNGKTRGFLTPDDRKYLAGKKEYESEGSEFNTRRRIRHRAEQGFKDFALLFKEMSDTDRKKLFQGDNTRTIRADAEFRESVRDTLAFFFQGLRGSSYVMGTRIRNNNPWRILLTAAVEKAALEQGFHVTGVDFDVDAEHVDVEQAQAKLDRGEELEAAEMKVLIDEGHAELKSTE